MAMKTPRYALTNPVSLLLDKPAAEFTRADLLKIIETKQVERITFHYLAIDGKLKELTVPAADRYHLESVLAEGERVDGSSLFKGMVDMSLSDLYVIPKYSSAFFNPFDEGSLDFHLPLPDEGWHPGALHAGQYPGPGGGPFPQVLRARAQRAGRARILPSDLARRPLLSGRGPSRLSRLGALLQERPDPARDDRPHHPGDRGRQVCPQRERFHRLRPEQRPGDRRAPGRAARDRIPAPPDRGHGRRPRPRALDHPQHRLPPRGRGHLHAEARGGRRRQRPALPSGAGQERPERHARRGRPALRPRLASSSAACANTPIP